MMPEPSQITQNTQGGQGRAIGEALLKDKDEKLPI